MIETTLFADFLLLWGSRFDPCTSMYEIPVSDSSDKPLQMFPMIVIVRALLLVCGNDRFTNAYALFEFNLKAILPGAYSLSFSVFLLR